MNVIDIQNKQIETERLILRHWGTDDAHSLFLIASDGRVSKMALWPTHTSEEMSREVIEAYFLPNPDCFAIELKESGELIGCIGLVPEGEEHYTVPPGQREVGYWLGFSYWHKGYTTEALNALIEYYKKSSTLCSLLLTTDYRNIASQRVAEKCGFVFFSTFLLESIENKAYHLNL